MKKIIRKIRPWALLGLYHCPWDDQEFNGARRCILGLDYDLLKETIDVFYFNYDRYHFYLISRIFRIVHLYFKSLDSITDVLVDKIIPRPASICGIMKRYNYEIAKIAEWPEFKIEWRRKRIKIGCTRITITYPVLRTRKATLRFFIYFKVPKSITTAAFNIAKYCGKSSALKGGVIGIVSGNLALAIAAFKASFKDCVKREIKKCIYPGLFTVKVVTGWK